MFRVGIGHDIHRLGPNRPLILGGLKIKQYMRFENFAVEHSGYAAGGI